MDDLSEAKQTLKAMQALEARIQQAASSPDQAAAVLRQEIKAAERFNVNPTLLQAAKDLECRLTQKEV